VVILQDEQLVIREIERHMQRVAAAASAAPSQVPMAAVAAAPAGVGAGFGSLPASVFPVSRPEPADAEHVFGVGEEGGSLAAVAKAASIKAERAAIEQTLRQVHWNRRKAAQLLGVSYKTLLNKIKECGISRV
jgi:DNA-binding NtrC family response regulator